MNLLCRTTFSQVGNSQAVIIPQKFMKSLKIPAKSKVEIFETHDGIFIKPVREWSAEKQSQIINDIVSFVGSQEDNELCDPNEFITAYCREKDDEKDWGKAGEC
jgi:antitoxin component of MazEF toxin-antitoxin module